MQGKLPETHEKHVQNANMKVYSRNFREDLLQSLKKPIKRPLRKEPDRVPTGISGIFPDIIISFRPIPV
jgi:hypothetical protein